MQSPILGGGTIANNVVFLSGHLSKPYLIPVLQFIPFRNDVEKLSCKYVPFYPPDAAQLKFNLIKSDFQVDWVTTQVNSFQNMLICSSSNVGSLLTGKQHVFHTQATDKIK